jgi:hypothetical protein
VAGVVLSLPATTLLTLNATEYKKAKKAAVVAAAKAAAANAPAPAPVSPIISLPASVSIPMVLAEKLLIRDPLLGPIRFKLVPGKVSEQTFWRLYFEQISIRVVQHINQLAAADD